MGPYAYKQSQWVGYDDPEMVARKADFIWQRGLAGGMVWALDLDDFNNMCGNGNYPLMKRLSSELASQTPSSTTTPPQPTAATPSPTAATPPPTAATTPSTTCTNQFVCPGRGRWSDPCDCSKFYICRRNKTSHRNCRSGLLWNDNIKDCDGPVNATC
ncbi:hypothetical protein Pmani_007052 [Petrolisthes manimaculis]|uniref:Chitinase n=1 Tax=Petrolisthes manimaculis TaxID=1843537 RepID=A0AAE1Q9J7_9EUCA|nr:hypothetical protein Pmani_007052 [Petrolisthes manimaculis]